MKKRTYAPAGRGSAIAAALCLLLLAAGCAGVFRGYTLIKAALDGRRTHAADAAHLSEFALREQMHSGQAASRVNAWQTVAAQETAQIELDGVARAARVFEPVGAFAGGGEHADAPWALVLHGGLGTQGPDLLDVACALSLEGYRVLLPDLHAHGASEGTLCSLGVLESRDVTAWVQWIRSRDAAARIVAFGQDEGAAALLFALESLDGAICAAAADSVYKDAKSRAMEMLLKANPHANALDRFLFGAAYGAMIGRGGLGADVCAAAGRSQTPLLVIHGTGDGDVPAWQGEDIARAAGENAQLLFIEGAAHGRARFAEPQAFYDALLGFFEKALMQ